MNILNKLSRLQRFKFSPAWVFIHPNQIQNSESLLFFCPQLKRQNADRIREFIIIIVTIIIY